MLELLYTIDFNEHEALMRLHTTFMDKFVRINGEASDASLSQRLSNHRSSLVIYKCFVPLLSSIQDLPDADALFRSAMIGLLDGLESRPKHILE